MLSGLCRFVFCRTIVAVALTTGTASVIAEQPLSTEQIAARIAEVPQDHALLPAIKLGHKALEQAADTPDYEALFVKKETVNGSFIEQQMQMRFRRQPMSVYLKFLKPNEGRQVIYVAGKNGDQMQVKETGLAALAGTINVDPHGSMALAASRHPITMIGMENMTRRVVTAWLDWTALSTMEVKFYPNAKIGTTECQVIETTNTARTAGRTVQKIRLYIEKTTGLPIRVQEYGYPPTSGGKAPLIADYAYLNVRPDVGMTAHDFDTRNPRYGF